MTDKELSIELEKWFIGHLENQNKWNRPTGKIISKYLNKTKNWKNAPRGNPKKGYLKMKEYQNQAEID